jgi:nitrate reductase gamma subunit
MMRAMRALLFVPYAAGIVFLTAVIVRCVRISRLPVHLRWELYPVAHERNAGHGGSHMERLDWWTHRRERDRLRAMRTMASEILLLRGVRAHNPALWLRSYPFHAGLYLLALLAVLLAVGAMCAGFGLGVGRGASGFGGVLAGLTTVTAVAGYGLLASGALGLLVRRLSQAALRAQSALADYLHLALFLVGAVLGLVTMAFVDRDLGFLRGFVLALATFRPMDGVPALVVVEVVLGSVLFAYIPLTHMSHFFTKWFMYHHVRWDDADNRVGSTLEASIERQLGYRMGWQAPHLAGEGGKTWAEIATQEVRKP